MYKDICIKCLLEVLEYLLNVYMYKKYIRCLRIFVQEVYKK